MLNLKEAIILVLLMLKTVLIADFWNDTIVIKPFPQPFFFFFAKSQEK